jgi:molecular chaperone GrpE
VSLDPEENQASGPVIRDKRRIDPVTGEVRERPDAGAHGSTHPDTHQNQKAEEQPEVTPDTTSVEAELAERTADLQRLQAEYVNYKRRVDRDKDNARKYGVESTLASLLPVLDDIARARDHGELTGGFKAVADSFERAVEKLGLVAFGEVGDEFDPRIHDALMHSYSDEVSGPTCQAILQVGYRIEDKVLRPARVAVAEPTVAIEQSAVADEDPVAADAAKPTADGAAPHGGSGEHGSDEHGSDEHGSDEHGSDKHGGDPVDGDRGGRSSYDNGN